MRHDVIDRIARIHGRLENLHALAGDLRAAKAANELLALAAEHAPDDDFYPARRRGSDYVHSEMISDFGSRGFRTI
jgi:hypothetical protein